MRVEDYDGCFACGFDNSRSLGLEFVPDGVGTVIAHWTGSKWYQGYPGLVHGGILCTLLDEGMATALQGLGFIGVTAKMEVRFRKPAPIGVELIVRAWVEEERGRKIKAKGEIRGRQGHLFTEGEALFIVRGGI